MTQDLGFTGTQQGLTKGQRSALNTWLVNLAPVYHGLHLGDCVGADTEVYALMAARSGTGLHSYRLIGHPPTNPGRRAFCAYDEERDPAPYLVRNRAIVDESHLLFAAPEDHEVPRSGTWSTIRYARRLGKPVIVFWPDGSTSPIPARDVIG